MLSLAHQPELSRGSMSQVCHSLLPKQPAQRLLPRSVTNSSSRSVTPHLPHAGTWASCTLLHARQASAQGICTRLPSGRGLNTSFSAMTFLLTRGLTLVLLPQEPLAKNWSRKNHFNMMLRERSWTQKRRCTSCFRQNHLWW